MIILVAWLFVETYRADSRERLVSNRAHAAFTLKKERCWYATISIDFGLSYMGRFIEIRFDECGGPAIGTEFVQEMSVTTIQFFEGLSMGTIMILHLLNFQVEKPLLTIQESSSVLYTIEQLQFFSDEKSISLS